VPASQAGLQAERLWRTGPLPVPPRRRGRLRRLLGSALTVILLAAAGVVLYVRFHHAPFHVTGVVIFQQAKTGCGVDVTGRITTNGAAGTVSYQWVYRPERQPPHPLSESVVAGQNTVYVTGPVEGQGHGSASLTVTLQVLGPDTRSASTAWSSVADGGRRAVRLVFGSARRSAHRGLLSLTGGIWWAAVGSRSAGARSGVLTGGLEAAVRDPQVKTPAPGWVTESHPKNPGVTGSPHPLSHPRPAPAAAPACRPVSVCTR